MKQFVFFMYKSVRIESFVLIFSGFQFYFCSKTKIPLSKFMQKSAFIYIYIMVKRRYKNRNE